MRSLKILIISLLFTFPGCETNPLSAVEVIKIPGLQQLMKERTHTVHVINFWATWCKPCVKELPLFTKLAANHPEVKISLVSLDYRQDLETKVYPFLTKKDITLRVLLMDELDYNLWIDLVDPSWSGAIPATLIIEPQTGRKLFLEKEFENDELEQVIQQFIKKNHHD